MRKPISYELAEALLESADIRINGSRAWDIQVHDHRLFDRVLKYYSLGLGEAYMEGWWDCEKIDEFIFRILNAKLDRKILQNKRLWLPVLSQKTRMIYAALVNQQSKMRSLQVGRKHYDIGNELYQCMLDDHLNYTCGYWKNAQTLNEAQIAKMDLVCRKLELKKDCRLLDIGCGFGAFAKYAATHYGVNVVGVTISKQQQLLAEQLCKGLPVEIRFQDYRDVREKFDFIVSLGMFEHVGYRNYATYMKIVDNCLKDDGIFLLHTIGGRETTRQVDPWIGRYIFPNSMLPSITQIGRAIEPHFVMEDWHNFALDYVKTLRAWHHNFITNWPRLKNDYSDRFYRMWVYYLLSSAGGFLAKSNQLWQIVLTKPTRTQAYQSLR